MELRANKIVVASGILSASKCSFVVPTIICTIRSPQRGSTLSKLFQSGYKACHEPREELETKGNHRLKEFGGWELEQRVPETTVTSSLPGVFV